MTQWRGGKQIRIRYFDDDSDSGRSTDNIGPILLILALHEILDLQCQTLQYFKSIRAELTDGEFVSTPNQSNPNVYKRRSGSQIQLWPTVGCQER